MRRQAENVRDDETYRRLTAPWHITQSHFSRHEKVEGYFEAGLAAERQQRSDRLLKIETVYGTIQLGYSPRKRQSFIFAANKTSIYGQAASRYQKEMAEYQAMRSLKAGTQNTAYTARRRQGSTVILYKAETLPWSHRSVAPYLDRADMGTLGRTMPFLDARAEAEGVRKMRLEDKALQRELAGSMAAADYAGMAALRARQTHLAALQNHAGALIYRKADRSRAFFRRLNIAFDLQKQEMFAYYKNLRQGVGTGYETPEPPDRNKGEDENE